MFSCKIKIAIPASSAYELHSIPEVAAFFLMSLWSCGQLFLLLKCLVGKHLEINGLHREMCCTFAKNKRRTRMATSK